MNLQTQCEAAVKAVCPIHGISFGNLADKETWRIDFKSEATTQQRENAQTVVNNFVFAPVDPASMDAADKALKAVGLLMRDYCNQLAAGTYTQKSVAQLKADFKTKFDALNGI